MRTRASCSPGDRSRSIRESSPCRGRGMPSAWQRWPRSTRTRGPRNSAEPARGLHVLLETRLEMRSSGERRFAVAALFRLLLRQLDEQRGIGDEDAALFVELTQKKAEE